MLASADGPIGPRLEVSDFTVRACWPILFLDHRMAMRNQARVGLEIECAVMPENQWQIASRHSVTRANLPKVCVVDEETRQAQKDRRYERFSVKAG